MYNGWVDSQYYIAVRNPIEETFLFVEFVRRNQINNVSAVAVAPTRINYHRIIDVIYK